MYLRTEIERVRQLGYAGRNAGLLGKAWPVWPCPSWTARGRAVAALSVGTISARLNDDRLPTVVELLKARSGGDWAEDQSV